LNSILRLAIASELVNCGFAPETVGTAVREIPESMLIEWAEGLGRAENPNDQIPVLCLIPRRGWRVRRVHEVNALVAKILDYPGTSHEIFILNFPALLDCIIEKLTQLAGAAAG